MQRLLQVIQLPRETPMTSACAVHIRGRVFTWFLPTALPAAPLLPAINLTSVISMIFMFSVMLTMLFGIFSHSAKSGRKFGSGYLSNRNEELKGPHDDWDVLLRKRI
jgi:hypothetical protein